MKILFEILSRPVSCRTAVCVRAHTQTHIQTDHSTHARSMSNDDDYSSYRFNECAEAQRDCLASECCQDEGYACFKKPHVQYAQCRPLGAREACEDTDEWRCPGWADCPEDYESCYDAKCMPLRRTGLSACLYQGPCTSGALVCCSQPVHRTPHAASRLQRPLGGLLQAC